MDDHRKQQLVEQYEDLALSLLMEDYADEEGERLLQDFKAAKRSGELPELPTTLDQKCRKIIDASFAKQNRGAAPEENCPRSLESSCVYSCFSGSVRNYSPFGGCIPDSCAEFPDGSERRIQHGGLQ